MHPQGIFGAPPGEYSVVISRLVDRQGQVVPLDSKVPPADLGAGESLPSKYSSLGETTLTAVVPSPDGSYAFDLKSR